MYLRVLCACSCRTQDLPELEVRMVASHLVDSRNSIQVLCKDSKCSSLLNHLSSPGLSVHWVISQVVQVGNPGLVY